MSGVSLVHAVSDKARPAGGPSFDIRRILMRSGVSLVCILAGVSWLPYWWCSRDADEWRTGAGGRHASLARGVEAWVAADLSPEHFDTGSKQFNGEWLFGTYLMAGLGFGQEAMARPEERARYVALMGDCIERLLRPEVRAFDAEMWGSDAIESLGVPEEHHAAYLGYFNLLLGLHRRLEPASPYSELNDQITAALVTRLEESDIGLLQSYPGEVYPVDNCAVIGSIGLYGRVTGADTPSLVREWVRICRARYVDPETGLLIQCVDPVTGAAADAPRGSGTTLGLYFLSFADRAFSAELYASCRKHLARKVFGFAGVREYPASAASGAGDIDSGPVVFGFGLSPTGFMIGGSQIHGDAEYFRRLWATAYVWGAPHERDGAVHFITGGSLGDAILFAMLTAGPAAAEEQP